MYFKILSVFIFIIVAICNGRRLPIFEHNVMVSTTPARAIEEKIIELSGPEGNGIFGHDKFDDYDDVMEGFFPDEPDYVLDGDKSLPSDFNGMKSDGKEPNIKFPLDDHDTKEEVDDDDKIHKGDRFPSEDKKDGIKFDQEGTAKDQQSEKNGGSNGLFDEDGYKSPSIRGGILLDTPFFNLEQMARYVKQLERAMEQVFRQTVEEALLLNGSYANNTEEEIDVDGKKFLVHKSVIQAGDNSSSILIEAVETEAKTDNRTKRSNWFSEQAQKPVNIEP